MTNSRIPATYERIADLPVVIDGYTLELLSRRVSTGFRRFTTVFALAGAGHHGVGEDVTYEAVEHRRAQSAGPVLPLAGTWTLEAFSRHLDRLDTFPDRPPMHEVSRTYRRWALESAALDLALRQARRSLHEMLGRAPAPVRFVVSLNLGPAPSCAPLLSRRAACGALRFKLDATSEWGDPLLECLAASGCVDAIDFKGVCQGTLSATRTDPDLYRRVARALPDAWLEDPDLSDPAARVALHSERHRVTWDAPIHSAADIAAQPWVARTVNIKRVRLVWRDVECPALLTMRSRPEVVKLRFQEAIARRPAVGGRGRPGGPEARAVLTTDRATSHAVEHSHLREIRESTRPGHAAPSSEPHPYQTVAVRNAARAAGHL